MYLIWGFGFRVKVPRELLCKARDRSVRPSCFGLRVWDLVVICMYL